MTQETRFISHALRLINDAVIGVIGMTDLHVRKTPLPRRLARRARARLKVLEEMLRKVIMLMALDMMGAVRSLPKMLARIRVLDGASSMPALPPRPVKAPSSRVQGLPPLARGDARNCDFSCLPISAPSGPIPIHKLVARIITLQRILQNPTPQARRLAFYYDRLKRRKRAPAPPPDIQIRRGPAELALIAGALPMELRRALAVWHDTS